MYARKSQRRIIESIEGQKPGIKNMYKNIIKMLILITFVTTNNKIKISSSYNTIG